MRRSIIVLLCLVSYGVLAYTAHAQEENTADSQCADVSVLMQQNKTPYDFTLGGGNLEGGRAENVLAPDHYADFWSFQVEGEGSIGITFDEPSGDLLEFALYKGMYVQEGYYTVEAGQTYSFNGTPATYTLVVRRVTLSNASETSYSLTVDGPALQPFATSVVQKTNGQPNDVQPTPSAGILNLNVTGTQYRFHPGAIGRINELRTDGSQVYFPNQSLTNLSSHTLYTGAWTQNIALLGGDLAINNGTDRIFFLESFAFEGNIAGSQGQLLLNNFTFPDDTTIRIDSPDLYGVWITDECTGFKLKDGRSFVAATALQTRELSIAGTLETFALQINALDRNNEVVPHKVNMSWSSVREGSEVSLLGGTWNLLLVGERELSLQSTELNFISQPPGENYPGLLSATLVDQETQVMLDWYNMRAFRLANDVIDLEFLDAPRGKTTRPGVGVELFEALGDVIHIIYKPQEDVAGEERLLLPAEDSYLEIITPAGDPIFDGTALPDQEGFAARSLNNLGGECYPVTNIMPQANCAPNGTPNPANGNLWVAMTDIFAHGAWVDLAVPRSYNSRGTRWTGPFGQGWTTSYLLDYDVVYDATTSSRPVTVGETYRVSLDVRYAPRGLLTFISPTGSQHPFVLYDDGTLPPIGSPEEYRAITMPGWVITRASVRSPWELRQDDGLIYQFDRAGRILRYGYPLMGRMIEIAYPRNTLNGAGSLGANTPIFITDTSGDDAPLRRIELYYNVDHQIVRSVLRDVSLGEPASLAGCDPKENCFETLYVYEAGRLVEVLYSDGQLAQYRYDDIGRLITQTDPYAPLAPDTNYGYSEGGDIASVTLANSTESLIWRTLTYQDIEGERQATVSDELGNTRTYVYTRLPDSLRRSRQDTSWQGMNKTTYVLVGETSPLAETNEYEATPQVYTWENGLLMQANTRGEGGRVGNGRLSYDFNYTPTGKLYCISCDFQGLPELRVSFVQGVDPRDPRVRPEDFLPASIAFTDGSSISYEYDDRRLVTRMTDRTGAIYNYLWSVSEPVVLQSVERENDGVVWEYAYNTLGLLTRSVERHAEENADTAYTIDYTWDALGQLVGITDSQMGVYTMAYNLPAPDDDGVMVRDMILTDPIGSATVRRYDTMGRLLESRLQDDTGALRRETYAYDLLGRLTEKANWVVDEDGSRPLKTTYTYRPQDTIDVRGLVPEGGTVTINGTRTEVTDPAGTQQIYIYDALDRLRVTFDETQRLSYYTYDTSDSGRDYGLRITHYEKLSGIATVNVNSFRFDSRWQLIGLERGTERWELFYDQGVSTRLRGLDSSVDGRTVTLQEVAWSWAGGALPQNVVLTQAAIDLNSRFTVESENKPSLEFSYDFLGRPLRLVDGADTSYPTLYCPRESGLLLTIYGESDSPTLTCSSRDVQVAVMTDMHGRVVEYRDEFGTRSFTYFADNVSKLWVVEIQMTDTAGQAFSWLMRYNAAGDLVEWFDEAGVTHSYSYDALGRLTAVTVLDQPEQSFVFSYNDANRLTKMMDGLGRGTLYNYNETDQVVSQLNARTADALSFAYTPTGQLTTVVSPVGNATTFLYEDPTNPARPTTVIDPTGNQHRYQWDDSTNSLIYTNPLNNVTRYRFDGTGLLWRIDDPLVVVPDSQRDTYRSHEIHYDSDGRMTDWLFDVRAGETASQQLTVTRDSLNTWTVSEAQADTEWSERLVFASSGQLIQVDGVRFDYDAMARLQQVSAGSATWNLAWQAGSPEVTLNNPFGLETITRYDALYRAISETVNETTTTYTYTPGALSEVTLDVERPGWGQRRYVLSPGNARSGTPPTITLLAYGQRTRYIFNGDGLLVEIVGEVCSDVTYATWEECSDAEVPSWTTNLQFDYDADERPIRVMDQDGNARTFAYDDADNLITYQTASGRTYSYAYDAAQRLISLTTATGVKLLFGYDTRDNLLGICRTRIDFSGDYAACAAQTDLTDGSGLLESYGYDTLDRLVQRTFPSASGTTNVPYEYDQSGRLTAIGAQRFSYNMLDLLESLDTDGATYDFSYHTLTQPSQAGDLAFVYDNTGRVIGYTSGGQTFSLLYSNDSLYSLQDDAGNRLEYAVDARGFLSGLNYNGDNLIQLEYIYDEHEPGINLYWNSAEPTVITSTTNRKKETQSQQFDGAGYFTLFYEITPTGLVQRHDITSLPGRSEGYIVVQGYDNDERPLTMRVTDSVGLQVLYTQTITYNTAGLRTGEQLQYADGTRVIKTLTYQDNSQLASQSVIIIRPLQVAAAAVWLLPLLLLRRRRGRILLAALLLGVIALPLLRAQTTQTEERYEFTYAYDAQGNLSHVDLVEPAQTCVQLEYDGANRLIEVERGEFTTFYAYDAYNRVTNITDDTGTTTLSYQGGTSRILSVKNDQQQMYYMQSANQPAFAALDVSGTVTWLITDGRERIYQTYQDGDNTRKDLWLFDPLGRVLTLQPPSNGDDFNPCALGGMRTVPDNVRLQSDPKGMVWDAASGVYFFEGRAYEAELGRYIQRDPQGPDALGNVYDGWTRQNVPIVQNEMPVYAEGLTILRDAMTAIRMNDHLSADAVKSRTLPQGVRTFSPVTTMTQESRQPFDQTVNGLANLPLWLQSSYNLPAPTLDMMGGYTMPQALAPGQGGTRTPFAAPYDRMMPAWDEMAMSSIKPPLETFAALTHRVMTATPGLRVYDSTAWMPQPLRLADFLQQPMAVVDRDFTPETVLALLPRTLAAPEQAAYTLDTVAFLYSLPTRPAYEWISQALDEAMPTRPIMPPQTLEMWEKDWFRQDLFGLGTLAKKIKPPLPFIPFYEWGDTPDWLHILK